MLKYSSNHVQDCLETLKGNSKVFYNISIFIDLIKAFDTLPFHLLLEKLDHYGVRGKALELISSYLQGRKQFVRGDDIESDILNFHV